MWDFLGINEWGLCQLKLNFPSVKWAVRAVWWGSFEDEGLLNLQGLIELTFQFAWEREHGFFWAVVYLLARFLLQSFPQPYSRNPVYLLEHKGLFYDMFGDYAPYRGCHGDEENQNNLNKVQILQGNNRDLHRLGNRSPNLENRWLLMDSVLGLGNLCQYLGELFNCVSTALHSELCRQKNIAGCRNMR